MAKTKDPLVKQAKREIRSTTVQPQMQALRRAQRQGHQDYLEAQQRVQQVTGSLLGQLGKIPGAYAGQTADIIPNVASGIGALGDQLGQDNIGQVPLAEQAAGIANVGAIGAGALEQIGGQQQNMADYLASGAQQGAVQGAVSARNYAKDYQNFTKDITQQKVDVIKSSRAQVLARLDQLKQEEFDRSMALKQLGMQQEQIDMANRSLRAEMKLRAAQAKWLLNHGRGRGRGRDNVDPALRAGLPDMTGVPNTANFPNGMTGGLYETPGLGYTQPSWQNFASQNAGGQLLGGPNAHTGPPVGNDVFNNFDVNAWLQQLLGQIPGGVPGE